MKFSWQKLPRPFTILAPMEGVTDVIFRQIIAEVGKPDVLFTEFTACDGLFSPGRERVEESLLFNRNERPIIAQIWGTNPDTFYKSAKDMVNRGFDGIDINMGCPVRAVIKDGACSGLIKNPRLAAEIIQAVRAGAGDLPVSVKTRVGFEKEQLEEWIGFLLRQNITALTVHLRTVREMSKVPAHWELMPEIIKLRNEIAPETVLIGNGDLLSMNEIEEKYNQYACEGFMVGRGIFTNPWMFDKSVAIEDKTIEERIDLYLHHIDIFYQTWGENKNFANLKKFAKTYLSNFPDASILRERLMLSKTIGELKEILLEKK